MQTRNWTEYLNGRVLAAASACLVLGVAFAFAQNDNRNDKAEAKRENPNAERKNAPDNAQNRQPGARAEAQARTRGHGLGFEAEAKDQGIRVTRVDEKGIAAQAGLKANDKIVSAGGRPFTRIRPLQAYLSGQGGQQIPIVIERDGQQYTIQYTPGQLQDDSAWLGVYLEEGDANTKGARITHVYPAGPAARAGLWTGDIVTRIGDEKIEDSADLISTVQNLEPQKRVDFAVLRNEQEVKVPVVLGRRDAFVYRDFDYGAQSRQYGQQGQFQNQGQNPNQGQNAQQYQDDEFENVPVYAMQLEHDRRNGEQHERIENEIRLLREEIAKLREELKNK